MKILFLDAYFQPENIAFAHLENDLIEELISQGHDIRVICPRPTRGITEDIYKMYKHKKRDVLYNGHLKILRFFAPREGKNPVFRAVRYFWCNIRTYCIGKKMKGIDAVFANSTPPTQGLTAGRVAKKLGVPFIYSLQDIFPDSLVTTGLTKENSFLFKIGKKIESATYGYCSRIIVISDSMKRNLINKNVSSDKISVVFNWTDPEKNFPVAKECNTLFDGFNISRQKFTVLYAGNFGEAQGAEIVLDAARKLAEIADIQFVIFGGGSGYEAAQKKALDLKNVFIHPLMPPDKTSEVYSMGDVSVITCKKGMGQSGMPSKTWSIMSCNTPIIASYDTDSALADVLKASGAGICIEPENSSLLADAIMKAYKKEICFSKSGRQYVLKYASKDTCVKEYKDIIESVAGNENKSLKESVYEV